MLEQSYKTSVLFTSLVPSCFWLHFEVLMLWWEDQRRMVKETSNGPILSTL